MGPRRLREIRRAGQEPEHNDGHATREARPQRPDRDGELRGTGSRERLAECHQVRERRLVQPAPALHVFAPEVADVRDRAAE